jgi:dipeptidyl aminopeptidase/acylaminoacyl peptidase
MTPDSLHLIRTPSTPTLHPSADHCVVSVTRPDDEANDYVGQLWEVPLAIEGTPRRITRGHRDTTPRYSPDGTLLAFLRAEPKGKPQLHVVDARGGEPIRLTDSPLGAGAPVWSPDSQAIAYVARVPETGRYGTDVSVGPEAEPPRHLTDLRYLEDGVGYAQDRRTHVFLLPIPDLDGDPRGLPEPSSGTQVTDGDVDDASVAWSPDGRRLAFLSARHDGRRDDLRSDAWTCAPDGSDLVRVTDTTLALHELAWSADGCRLWLVGHDLGPSGTDFVGRSSGLWSVPADGSAPPQRHTDTGIDLSEEGAHLTVTDAGVLVQDRTRGAVRLLRVGAGGVDEPAEVLLEGPAWVTGHDAVGPVIVATVQSAASAGEVLLLDGDGGRRLTDFSADLDPRPLHEVTVPADDGYPVHGWLVLPDGPGPHPVLLDIHGGPFAQFGWKPYDQAQVLATAGYAVLLANPRGAAGYGEDHARAIVGAMGQRDAADLLQFLDGVLADPAYDLDAARVGALGGSYGGYMTAWLLATAPDRFVAGVVERGFLDPESFIGTSDIGWFFPEAYLGAVTTMPAQSPMALVDRVTAPTLVIHSENDLRCPLEQGQRYFAGLLRAGVRAELLVFPGESHGLTRGGQPRHRRQRFEHLLTWWETHLPIG